jgi:membrane protease YdiL (CAAX protease family)
MSDIQAQIIREIPQASSLKQWIARQPVAAYFVLAFLSTWILQLPMVLGQDGLSIFHFSIPLPIYIVLFLASSFTGPTGAAVYITSVLEGQKGVRRFFGRYKQWRIGLRWYLFAFFALPLIYLVAAMIFMGIEPLTALVTHWQVFFTTYLPALLIFPAFITWGEEPGWRGFALTRLQEKYSPLVSSVIVGLLHGLWHLPVFMIVNGPPALGPFDPIHFLVNTFGIMMITLIWTWVFNNAKGSILMAVLLHASSNATSAFIGTLIPDLPKQVGHTTFVIYFLLAAVLVVTTNGLLGYQSKQAEIE